MLKRIVASLAGLNKPQAENQEGADQLPASENPRQVNLTQLGKMEAVFQSKINPDDVVVVPLHLLHSCQWDYQNNQVVIQNIPCELEPLGYRAFFAQEPNNGQAE